MAIRTGLKMSDSTMVVGGAIILSRPFLSTCSSITVTLDYLASMSKKLCPSTCSFTHLGFGIAQPTTHLVPRVR